MTNTRMLWTLWICGEPRDGSAARVRTLTALRLADLSDRLAKLACVPSSGQLRGDKDADELSVIYHREPSNLTLRHELLGRIVAVVRRDRDRVRAHDRADRGRLCILPRCDRSDHDVPVGDDADELAVRHDRQRPA